MKPLTKVNFIVIHCADTKSDMFVTVKDLRDWHTLPKPKGNGWSDIGYHYFIKFDGTVYDCRSNEYQGAHCKTVNDKSLAICLEGGYGGVDNFTPNQKHALFCLIQELKQEHGNAAIIGHNQIDDKKCPSFNVVAWYEGCISEYR